MFDVIYTPKFYPLHSRFESNDMSDNNVNILGVGVWVGIADDAPVCLQDECNGGKLREDHQLGNVCISFMFFSLMLRCMDFFHYFTHFAGTWLSLHWWMQTFWTGERAWLPPPLSLSQGTRQFTVEVLSHTESLAPNVNVHHNMAFVRNDQCSIFQTHFGISGVADTSWRGQRVKQLTF